ncbi:alpha/beta hydrolase [Blastococcus sp. CCUG 61487]|uniref:alpha/beta fold hydrolase n=1 Tax=Blastococcus sp. CCUG 61487 TaxID=1840703 RepID=UPI0010C08FFC|nr:alpha/beta hydrolase [Blastococcus sp. CCUG 61487]TKJ32763.1 alpha/beta hydrolase [Blastococcus sp. CCUG 61487]
MTTFVLIPGAGGRAAFWALLTGELTRRGHRAVAVDLPADDETAGLQAYTDTVVAALGTADPEPVVVVGQSMGGLTAPLVCARVPVRLLVLLNAMIPRPGETGGEWWTVTGQGPAQAAYLATLGLPPDIDEETTYLHDVPPEARALDPAFAQSGRPFEEPWPLRRWPDVPTRVLAGRHDRLFPLEFQRRLAAERLGVDVDEIDGGHLVALSRPGALAERLESYLRDGRAGAT